MIEIRDLTKNYGARTAIDKLNFTIQKGEVVGFLGPNGAGKTTTMKILTGFMAPSSGSVKVAGFDVFENPMEVKRRIGYLPETPPVYGDMVVGEYLRFVAQLKKVEAKNLKSFVDEALEKTHLQDVRGRLIQNLSKGFRQRVGIAQALVSKPEYLILDEPTVGLDPRQVAEIRQLLLNLRGQHTIILSTHILPEVEATCQRVIIIDHGKIVAENTLSGLANQGHKARTVAIKVRRNTGEFQTALKEWPTVKRLEVHDDRLEIQFEGGDESLEKLAHMIVNRGVGLLEMIEPTKGLESAFIQLTSHSGDEA